MNEGIVWWGKLYVVAVESSGPWQFGSPKKVKVAVFVSVHEAVAFADQQEELPGHYATIFTVDPGEVVEAYP